MCFEQVTSMYMQGHVKLLRLFVLLSYMTYCLPAMAQFHNADLSNTKQYRQFKYSDQGKLFVVPNLPGQLNEVVSGYPVRDLDFPCHGVWDYHPLHPRSSAKSFAVEQVNLNIALDMTIPVNFTKAPVVDVVFPWQALEPYIHQTHRTQFIEQAQSPSLPLAPMMYLKIGVPPF